MNNLIIYHVYLHYKLGRKRSVQLAQIASFCLARCSLQCMRFLLKAVWPISMWGRACCKGIVQFPFLWRFQNSEWSWSAESDRSGRYTVPEGADNCYSPALLATLSACGARTAEITPWLSLTFNSLWGSCVGTLQRDPGPRWAADGVAGDFYIAFYFLILDHLRSC